MAKRRGESPITDVLRQAIIDSGMPYLAIERETGVKRDSVSRFLRGEQSLRLDMADRLAAYFGIGVVPPKRRKKG